ncbi:hypothetical protein PAXRUDRAFT_159519, partial [Paxillus rubicundulus Ve08.2h10]
GNGRVFSIPGFMYQSITFIIKSAFSEHTAKWFHLTPFKHVWKSPVTGQIQQIYDKLYCSDAWNDAHDNDNLQKQKQSDGCELERVIASLMFWSDSTQLAQFGHAFVWPIYLFFRNLSKHYCGTPNSGACHPVGFISMLPDSIKNFLSKLYPDKRNHDDTILQCRHELFHAIWALLLDDYLVEAYKNGIEVTCYDGIKRHVFPRIFTYLVDYPEKAIIATIHDKGICPCPWCLSLLSSFGCLGLCFDASSRLLKIQTYLQHKVKSARDAIYKQGIPIKGATVECILKEFSLVPTILTHICHSGVIDCLSPVGFDLFPALVVDLLHQFELGVLKSVLKHLIQMLYAIDPGLVAMLNERLVLSYFLLP